MYAIVSIAGQQFKVEKGKKVFVHKLPGAVGDEVSFDKVLLVNEDEKVNVGTPYVADTVVYAQIVSQLRGDKVLVFKKKRRKGYQKLNGHRQYFTEILIDDIARNSAPRTVKKKAAEAKKEDVVETAPVKTAEKAVKAEKVVPKATVKKPAAPKAKSEETKKPAAKKKAETAVKKPAAKKPAAKSESKPKKASS